MKASSLSIGILIVAAVLIVIGMGFNYVVDPYSVFGSKFFPRFGEAQERYLKIDFLKKTRDFESFILGSSRVGVIDPTDFDSLSAGAKTYNLTASQANQWDVEQLIDWLIANQPKLKRVLVQVDWPNDYGNNRSQYALLTAMPPDLSGRSELAFFWDYLSTFNFEAISEKISNNSNSINAMDYDLRLGNWSRPARDTAIDQDCVRYVSRESASFAAFKLTNDDAIIRESLAAISRYSTKLKAHNIELRIFLTPHSWRYLNEISFTKYVEFISALVKVGDIYNFMYYSQITENDCNYYEASHYRPKVGKLIATALTAGKPPPDDSSYLLMNQESVSRQLEFLRRNFSTERRSRTP